MGSLVKRSRIAIVLAVAASALAHAQVVDDSNVAGGSVLLAITTTVTISEVKIIESKHLLVIKRADSSETELNLGPNGIAIARTNSLFHATFAPNGKGEADFIAKNQFKKGDRLVSRAIVTIDSGAPTKTDKVLFTKGE